MSAWPPRHAYGANARPTKAKAHRPATTPQRGVPTVRQQVGNQVPGARLVYRTFLRPARDVLTQRDLQEIFAAQPAPAAAAPTGAAAGTATAAAAQPAARTLTITETRKRELLLLYLNSLIDILFAR
jgi:ribosomal protein L12E/L44/L45/RPP1/RPP2